MRTLQHKTKYYVIYGGKTELARYVTKDEAETMYYGYKNAVSNGWIEIEGTVTMKEEWR